MPKDVETLLRDTMAHRGETLPGGPLAGEAIVARGQRVRRLRTRAAIGGVAVAVVGLLVGVAGVGSTLGSGPAVVPGQEQPLSNTTKAAIMVKGKFSLPGGRTVTLPAPRGNEGTWYAAPVVGGWLAHTSSRAMTVTPAGAIKPFFTAPVGKSLSVSVAPDGSAVAVMTDLGKGSSSVEVFEVANRRSVGRTPVRIADPKASSGYPLSATIAGWRGRSLILGAAPYKGMPRIGLWQPGSGPWNGVMTKQQIGIVDGSTADGGLLGVSRGQNRQVCVGFVDPTRSFTMSGQSCVFEIDREVPPLTSLAPEGKWAVLAQNGAHAIHLLNVEHGKVDRERVFDLPEEFSLDGVVWEDAKNFLAIGNPVAPGAAIMRCSVSSGTCVKTGLKVPADADLGQLNGAAPKPQAAK